MSYRPSFFEAFVGLVIALIWGRWLEGRGARIGWVTTLASVVVALGVLAGAVLVALEPPDLDDDPRLIAARWAPFAAVIAALAIEAVVTLRLGRRG